jgi:hypothetical protein
MVSPSPSDSQAYGKLTERGKRAIVRSIFRENPSKERCACWNLTKRGERAIDRAARGIARDLERVSASAIVRRVAKAVKKTTAQTTANSHPTSAPSRPPTSPSTSPPSLPSPPTSPLDVEQDDESTEGMVIDDSNYATMEETSKYCESGDDGDVEEQSEPQEPFLSTADATADATAFADADDVEGQSEPQEPFLSFFDEAFLRRGERQYGGILRNYNERVHITDVRVPSSKSKRYGNGNRNSDACMQLSISDRALEERLNSAERRAWMQSKAFQLPFLAIMSETTWEKPYRSDDGSAPTAAGTCDRTGKVSFGDVECLEFARTVGDNEVVGLVPSKYCESGDDGDVEEQSEPQEAFLSSFDEAFLRRRERRQGGILRNHNEQLHNMDVRVRSSESKSYGNGGNDNGSACMKLFISDSALDERLNSAERRAWMQSKAFQLPFLAIKSETDEAREYSVSETSAHVEEDIDMDDQEGGMNGMVSTRVMFAVC